MVNSITHDFAWFVSISTTTQDSFMLVCASTVLSFFLSSNMTLWDKAHLHPQAQQLWWTEQFPLNSKAETSTLRWQPLHQACRNSEGWMRPEGRTLRWYIDAFIKEGGNFRKFFLQTHVPWKARKSCLTETEFPAPQSLTSGFQGHENIHFCCLSPQLSGILL